MVFWSVDWAVARGRWQGGIAVPVFRTGPGEGCGLFRPRRSAGYHLGVEANSIIYLRSFYSDDMSAALQHEEAGQSRLICGHTIGGVNAPPKAPPWTPAFAGVTVGGLRMTAERARTVLMLRQGPLSLCAHFKKRLPCRRRRICRWFRNTRIPRQGSLTHARHFDRSIPGYPAKCNRTGANLSTRVKESVGTLWPGLPHV